MEEWVVTMFERIFLVRDQMTFLQKLKEFKSLRVAQVSMQAELLQTGFQL